MAQQTIPQEEAASRRLQTDISEEAHERLRVEAARRECAIGVVVSDLAMQLPEPKRTQEQRNA